MTKEGLILIVEDDAINKQLLTKLFEDTYDIVDAANGAEALDILRQREDDLSAVILDLYMPVMNGYSVLEIMSRNNKWRDIPVVIATSESSLESDQRLLDLGACCIIHKPINAGIIKRQITNIVTRAKNQKRFLKDYMLQKTLINQTANTFLCSYHVPDRHVTLGENYRDFVSEDFISIFDTYPFQLENFVLPKNLAAAQAFFDIEHKEHSYDEIELRFRIDTMHYEWFKISMMIKYNDQHKPDSVVFLFSNIEYAVDAKERLTFMAMNDLLTHIPNMRTFSDDVRNMLWQYPDEDFVMVTMDIYQFNLVNKLFGYNEGNNVLKYFATKLQELVESFEKGVYCRMASDVFYACFSQQEDMKAFLTTLQDCMHNYPIKFDLKLCFGIYHIADRNEDVENMIEHSSYARTESKKSPFQSNPVYNEQLQKKEYFEAVVVSEMETALNSGQFEIYLQPKCSLLTQKVIGSEALIRWNHPVHGFISPGIFIPILEQNGFITELDYFVYHAVCKMLRRWLDNGMKTFPVSVNVSRCDLYDSQLCDRILQIVDSYQIPHNLIEFEITESAFVLESTLLMNFTEKLRKNGFCVLIDDFGTGYSSLNSLKDILVDILKIDMAFLPTITDDVKSCIILASIIDMAQKLGLDIIAEGMETKEQLELLTELGCEKVQGYYFYKPMPIQDFEKIIAT